VAGSLMLEQGVARAVEDTRRAVELATGDAEEVVSGALAAHARALYFAGELDRASAVASRCLEHAEAARRAPSAIHARATLALVGVERGRLVAARAQAEHAREVAGGIGTGRSWLDANASAAVGSVLLAEGRPAEAEQELAAAGKLFAGEVASVHQAWLLVLLARARIHRGRIQEAGETLASALQVIEDLPDVGVVAALASEVERELDDARERAASGALLDAPSPAELSVLRLLETDLSVREIGLRLFLSSNTIRSHMRSLYRKLGVHTRGDAVVRATALGLLDDASSHG
jgi:LuxR family transcriptional regulator, maltose regulon positive regulatory protein